MNRNGNFSASYSTTGFCVTFVGPSLGRDRNEITKRTMFSEIFVVYVGLTAEEDVILCPFWEMSLMVPNILNNSECLSFLYVCSSFCSKELTL